MKDIAPSPDQSSGIRAKVQAFGGFLTNMVLPNIGAFIAWGILTALFIPTGWIPNESLANIVGPAINYLLPLLLAYTGGKMVGGKRGAVMGAVGTFGLIVGADIPMFLGAMIVGPLGGWIIKKFDKAIHGKVPAGFEMIVNNFSLGILGFLLMISSYLFTGPAIEFANNLVKGGIQVLIDTGMLPLLSLINEPAKVLFLNNAIDQGIYYPLGMQRAAEVGKSIYFTVASNPGPGLGLLLAYTFFGSKTSKRTAPGAIIIHFFGGIHELYFPYVLMNPITIIGMIGGAMSGIATFQLFNVGLVAGPSPGSIFAYLALTPKGNFLGIIAGVLVATVVSFIITSFTLKAIGAEKEEDDKESFEQAAEKSKSMKEEGKKVLNSRGGSSTIAAENISKIAFACDAGAGSSALGATTFRKKLKKNNIEGIEVEHYNIEDVPEDADVIVVHKNLADRARRSHQNKRIVTIENFIGDPNLESLLAELK
ncbi:PTS mannitol transporter subunit IICB [Halanaerobium kushneri]|jgi:PTS system mannitol-specific IIC component|uniref:PTS system mannitol-specific EIICB component n=1 Tax=Halanaerobium kushneri TaxID=56779 RepID=A0A1N6ZPG0_9FIRM|nr:PTS mannitol transporter subunit IICB [Halanaerobium kushneri]PUU93857.1 MAG: PTS system, mannitol-specific IIC component [Halanaerobium sp.]SIR28694.1 PTS system D-mannitol-specific IIB component, Fru family /PTS system D-mannitol-specific IIC component, Fru family [Halanaerobium kushneri]